MKFSISKKDLQGSINKVIKATALRTTIPHLSGIKLIATEGELTLFASDLETTIQVKTGCMTEVEGEVAVLGKIFANVINALPETTVVLEEDGESLKISAGHSEFSLRKINPDDFSHFPQIVGDQIAVVPADVLSGMIKKVSRAVSRDESKVVLTGVLLTIEDDLITMTSTDSYRLALVEQNLKQPVEESFEVLIPGKILDELARMISGDELIRIEASANQVLFSFMDTKMLTRRLEGKFPNVKQLIPSENATRAIVDHADLLDSVKRVSNLALNNAAIDVSISATNQTLSLSAKAPELGTARDDILIKTEGIDNNISINFSYFLDGLNSINTETVYLEIQEPMRPGVLRAPEENFTYLVMPVRQ
ncbi:MAG: DNA polymerase III subunit beta [Coriobacteriia bacterium]|nr:DNA polymerase III subunit beta [Coriobacteriia bacterium]MCL2537123.1 DNA polymerase III subunit beta [Coriobacteriia bacterium]